MKLPKPLVVAALTFALVAWALPAAARNGQEPAGRQPAATPTASESENLFWQSIMNSTNPADFEAYLEVFPNALFRRLAENRLETLSTTATPNAVAGNGSSQVAARLNAGLVDRADEPCGGGRNDHGLPQRIQAAAARATRNGQADPEYSQHIQGRRSPNQDDAVGRASSCAV